RHQAVDTDTLACSRRHAVFQRADEVGIEMHGLVVAGVLLGHLGVEALGLILGIVQLGIGVGNLTAADEQLEAVGDVGVLVVATRQRRDLERVLGNKGRLL